MTLAFTQDDVSSSSLSQRYNTHMRYTHQITHQNTRSRTLNAPTQPNPTQSNRITGEELTILPDGTETAGPLTRRVWDAITDIQYGKVAGHPWSVLID